MNEQQKRYAMERVKEITRDKIRIVNKDLVPSLDYGQKMDMIRSGFAKMIPGALMNMSNNADIHELYDFREHDKRHEASEKAIERRIETIRRDAVRIKDRIMLGDAEEAIQMLELWAASAV